MKNQALFSLKDKSKKLKYHLLQFLFGSLRVDFASDLMHAPFPFSEYMYFQIEITYFQA